MATGLGAAVITREERFLLHADDLSLELLASLAILSAGERDAWIDSYVLGDRTLKQLASNANRKLRAYFGTERELLRLAA